MKIGDSLYSFSQLTPKLYNNIFDQKMKKVLAFKENIFVHNKNLSLNENNKNSELIKKNSTKKNKYLIKNKNRIYNIRPNSAFIKYNPNNHKNSLTKSRLILNQDYFDISYMKNSDSKINDNNNSKKKKKVNQKLSNHKKNKSINISYNFMNEFDEVKMELNNKIINIKFAKKNYPQMFRRRPIPPLNEKYIYYLPKNIKKDTKNKYNIFNFILTDNIFINNIKNSRNKNKSKNKYNEELNINKNNSTKNNNTFNNYLLGSKIAKNSTIINLTNKKLKTSKIYKPVRLKIAEVININKIKEKNDNIKSRNINDEEGYLFQKIKSHPFNIMK